VLAFQASEKVVEVEVIPSVRHSAKPFETRGGVYRWQKVGEASPHVCGCSSPLLGYVKLAGHDVGIHLDIRGRVSCHVHVALALTSVVSNRQYPWENRDGTYRELL
jgi:hypothetical protein